RMGALRRGAAPASRAERGEVLRRACGEPDARVDWQWGSIVLLGGAMKTLMFSLLLAVGLGGFGWTIWRFIQFMRVGGPDLPTERIPERLLSVLVYWLGQKKVTEKTMDSPPRGFTSNHHVWIFWGFLIVTI